MSAIDNPETAKSPFADLWREVTECVELMGDATRKIEAQKAELATANETIMALRADLEALRNETADLTKKLDVSTNSLVEAAGGADPPS
jgi:chromosome segregation ATPase